MPLPTRVRLGTAWKVRVMTPLPTSTRTVKRLGALMAGSSSVPSPFLSATCWLATSGWASWVSGSRLDSTVTVGVPGVRPLMSSSLRFSTMGRTPSATSCTGVSWAVTGAPARYTFTACSP